MYPSFLGIGCVLDFFLYLQGHFGHFFQFMGLFWLYLSNRGYFVLF